MRPASARPASPTCARMRARPPPTRSGWSTPVPTRSCRAISSAGSIRRRTAGPSRSRRRLRSRALRYGQGRACSPIARCAVSSCRPAGSAGWSPSAVPSAAALSCWQAARGRGCSPATSASISHSSRSWAPSPGSGRLRACPTCRWAVATSPSASGSMVATRSPCAMPTWCRSCPTASGCSPISCPR